MSLRKYIVLLQKGEYMTIDSLYAVIKNRQENKPEGSYVASLIDNSDRLIQKIGEEATEVVIAAKNENRQRRIEELADLLFHSVVLWAALGITPEDIYGELDKRKK